MQRARTHTWVCFYCCLLHKRDDVSVTDAEAITRLPASVMSHSQPLLLLRIRRCALIGRRSCLQTSRSFTEKPVLVIFRGEAVTGSRRLCKYSHIASLHLELTQYVSVKPCVKKLRAARKETFSRRFRLISGGKIPTSLTADDAAGVPGFLSRFSVE